MRSISIKDVNRSNTLKKNNTIKKKSAGSLKPTMPMLATLTDGPFDDENFLFEIKYDGYRATAIIFNNRVELYSRNLKSFNSAYPGIVKALQGIDETVILDGEIVAENSKGISDFQLLQNNENTSEKMTLKYYVFDLLHLNGHDLFDLPLVDRKNLLKLVLENSKKLKNIFYSKHTLKKGISFYDFARKKHLEGIMAKEINSPYYPGRRSGNWLKIKISLQQELIIIGMTAPKGSRGFFGSLLLGYYDRGRLKYAGNCGTGFTETTLAMIHKKAKKYFTQVSPLHDRIPVAGSVQWMKPVLVCQVKFTEWTRSGSLRHPVYLGLRNDKKATSIIREKPSFHHG